MSSRRRFSSSCTISAPTGTRAIFVDGSSRLRLTRRATASAGAANGSRGRPCTTRAWNRRRCRMKTGGCGPRAKRCSGLPARDRLLLALRAQELSYRDIAVAAGIRPSSVGRLLARALDRWGQACGRGRGPQLAPDRENREAWTHMKCLNDAQIQAVVDREAADDVRKHAESCVRCGDRVREREALSAAVVQAINVPASMPPGVSRRVRAGAVGRIEPGRDAVEAGRSARPLVAARAAGAWPQSPPPR